MDYNSEREPVILREYGRNMQNLINHLRTIKDKNRRTELAHQMIQIMRMINPSKETAENYQRAWDQLFVMAGFDLDIDAPFEKPTPEATHMTPGVLPYPQSELRYRHFGKNLERMIEAALALPDPNTQRESFLYIARLMKTFYSPWAKELSHRAIADTLFELTNGKINLRDDLAENPGLIGATFSNHVSAAQRDSHNQFGEKNRRKKKYRHFDKKHKK